MSSSFLVYFNSPDLPAAHVVESAIARREPGFRFAEPFDFAGDSGRCPCFVRKLPCGFEWELETGAEAEAEGHAAAGALIFRSSDADRICALLVAAGLAECGAGVVVDADGDRLEAAQAFAWAMAELSTLRAPKKKVAKAHRYGPAADLQRRLTSLAGATVTRFNRMAGADRLVALQLSNGDTLQAERWAWTTPGASYSTRPLPRDVPEADLPALAQGLDGLVAILRSGPLGRAALGPDLSLTLGWPGGEVVVFAEGNGYASEQERLMSGISDPWEYASGADRFRPDVDEQAILRR